MTSTADIDVAVQEAAAILHRGGLVAFPTETVYGLGADAVMQILVIRWKNLKMVMYSLK